MEGPDFALPPGTLLGNYKLLKVLDRGGFGITYIAWDNQLRRNIVLKECFPLGAVQPGFEYGRDYPVTARTPAHLPGSHGFPPQGGADTCVPEPRANRSGV